MNQLQQNQLQQLLTASRQTIIKAVLHDLKVWAVKPLNEYTDVDGSHPSSLDDLLSDVVTREVEHISEGFQKYLGIPDDEDYSQEAYYIDSDFRRTIFDEIYHSKEYDAINS